MDDLIEPDETERRVTTVKKSFGMDIFYKVVMDTVRATQG